jgi:hypothetical protein
MIGIVSSILFLLMFAGIDLRVGRKFLQHPIAFKDSCQTMVGYVVFWNSYDELAFAQKLVNELKNKSITKGQNQLVNDGHADKIDLNLNLNLNQRVLKEWKSCELSPLCPWKNTKLVIW